MTCTKAGIAKIRINHVEVSVVEGVEEFAAELQAETFCDFDVPDGGEIPILESWTQQDSNTRGTEMAHGGRHERCSIEPLRKGFRKET